LRGRSIGIAATVLFGIGVGIGHVIWWLPYDLWNPVLLGIGHGIGWFFYDLWNPVLLGIGHGIGWFFYHLWNPVLLGFGHWLFKVLLALVAVGSVADVIRYVVEALCIPAIVGIVVERRRARQRLRQQAVSRRSGSRSRPSLEEAAPAADRSEAGSYSSRPFVEEPQLPDPWL
jgi:hypothetical protein